MKSIKQKFDIFFIFCFLLCLIIPCLRIDYKSEKSEKENRTLAKYEKLISNGKINKDYGKQFESWFNDRFFGRFFLIKLNQYINSPLGSKIIRTDKFLLGKEDWYFYRGEDLETDYTNRYLYTDEQMNKILNYLTDFNTWCSNNNIIFIVFVCPDKPRVYGDDFYPDGIKKIRNKSKTQQFLEYAKQKNPNLTIVYPLQELLDYKKSNSQDLLYFKNDTHWDDKGAYIGYKQLEKKLLEYGLDSITPITVSEWGMGYHPVGDLNALMPNVTSIDNETLYPIPSFRFTYVVDEEKSKDQVRTGVFTTCADKKMNAYVFRDSFCTAVLPYISNNFASVEYYWKYEVLPEDLYKIKNNFDVVIFQTVERYFQFLGNYQFPEEQ